MAAAPVHHDVNSITVQAPPASLERVPLVVPDFAFPPGGVHIRWPDDRFSPEARLLDFKLPRALLEGRANFRMESWVYIE